MRNGRSHLSIPSRGGSALFRGELHLSLSAVVLLLNVPQPQLIFSVLHRRGNGAALAGGGGDSGSGGSIPSSATGNSDETNSVDEHSMMLAAMNNNNNLDNGMSEICDVPDHVANQKRHVSTN